MQTILFESPWLIGTLAVILVGVLLFAWIQSGVASLIKAAAGAGLVGALLLSVNLLVQTEREKLTAMMQALADDLQNNRFQAIAQRVHPDASVELRNLENRIQNVEFKYVSIKKIHGIDIGKSTHPKSAAIRMNVVVEGSQAGSAGTVPRWVRIFLEQDQDEWKIVDYEHRDPQYEMLNQQGKDRLDSMYRR